MAMRIESYEFSSLQGPDVPAYGEVVEELSRPGIDGHTFRLIGKRGSPFQLQTVATFESEKDAKDAVANFSALQGSFITLERGSQSFANVIVLSVANAIFPLGSSTDGASFGVRSSWNLQRAG